MSTEDPSEQYELVWTRLLHVLSFFDRVDTKLSVVLGTNVALLGVLSTQATLITDWSVFAWTCVGAYGVLSAFSFYFLYRGSFPHLDGGEGSLIYFKEIAKRPRDDFAAALLAQSPQGRLDDALEQLWQNASILNGKFRYLCRAYLSMAASLVPWAAALITFATQG